MNQLHPCNISDTAILFTQKPWQPNDREMLLSPFVSIMGQTLLQRSISNLVRWGCRHIHVVLDDGASSIRASLQHGERWGCCVTYHYPDPNNTLPSLLLAIGMDNQHHYLIGNAWAANHVLAYADNEELGANGVAGLCGQTGCWTGEALVTGSWLLAQHIPTSASALAANITADDTIRKQGMRGAMTAHSAATLLGGMKQLPDWEGNPAYCSPQADVHPSACLIAPYHIGKSVRIGAGATIGPHVVIESDVYIGANTTIRDSLILPGSYIGPSLQLEEVVVRGPTLLNARLSCRTDISDPHILSYLHPPAQPINWADKLIAGMLQLVLYPFHRVLQRQEAPICHGDAIISAPGRSGCGMNAIRLSLRVPQPAPREAAFNWRYHFVTTFYPGLSAVRQGKLQLIGPTIRKWHEVRQLPEVWRHLYETRYCGLLNDAWLTTTPATTPEECFACDAIASASRPSPMDTLRQVSRYLHIVWHCRHGIPIIKPGAPHYVPRHDRNDTTATRRRTSCNSSSKHCPTAKASLSRSTAKT